MPADLTPSRKVLAELTDVLHQEIASVRRVRERFTDESRAELEETLRAFRGEKLATLREAIRWLETIPRTEDVDDDGVPCCPDCGDTLTSYPFGRALCNSCDHAELLRLERVAEHPAFCWTCGHVHVVEAIAGVGKVRGVCDECRCTRCLTSLEKMQNDLAGIGATRTQLPGGFAMYEIPAPPKGGTT
ncbi:MAG TPA: hypothetical protein VJT85_00060 [Gemmatimonadaceae bacterium]|nr:hypothetical protein [Gemmatimonadaceae bacterium]